MPVDARRRAQGYGSRLRVPGYQHQHQHHAHLPVAMLGGIVEGIGNSLRRLREGTTDLVGNAKQLGSLKCVPSSSCVRDGIESTHSLLR